ncbi:MAG: ABC-type lipoprotein release transport system permease subunit, partial [Rhodothermales bacterium]
MSSSTLSIAWRNLGRNRRRTALAVMAVGVGQFALLLTMSLMHGYADNIRQAITGPMIGHVQVHHPQWREERAMDLSIPNVAEIAARIRQEPDVASVSARIYAPCLVAAKLDAHAALVVGLDIACESEPYGLLSDMGEVLAPRHVLAGYRLAQRLQLTAGQEVALVGQAPNG